MTRTHMLWQTLIVVAAVLPLFSGFAAAQARSAPRAGTDAAVVTLAVTEASGIAALPDGSFLVVDDDRGLFRVTSDGEATLLLAADAEKNFGGLEGVCLSSRRDSLYCLSERKGHVIRIPMQIQGTALRLGAAERLGKLPPIGKKENKGWEGICICLDKGRDLLVAVHQDHPRAVGLFDLPSLDPIAVKELAGPVKARLDNLSDVAMDHRTGRLLLLSGKSQRLLEIDFTPTPSLTTFHLFTVRDLPLTADERPEGVCFDAADRLVVVTDGSGKPGKLLRLGK